MELEAIEKDLMCSYYCFEVVLFEEFVDHGGPKYDRTVSGIVESDSISKSPLFILNGIGPNKIAVQNIG